MDIPSHIRIKDDEKIILARIAEKYKKELHNKCINDGSKLLHLILQKALWSTYDKGL